MNIPARVVFVATVTSITTTGTPEETVPIYPILTLQLSPNLEVYTPLTPQLAPQIPLQHLSELVVKAALLITTDLCSYPRNGDTIIATHMQMVTSPSLKDLSCNRTSSRKHSTRST